MKLVTHFLALLACVSLAPVLGEPAEVAFGHDLLEDVLREADRMFGKMDEMNRLRHHHHHHHDQHQSQDGRTVKVVARLPPSATADDVLSTLQEMEKVASAVFADEDLWEKVFTTGQAGLMRTQTQDKLKGKDGPLSGACHNDVSCFCGHVASKEDLAGNPSAEVITKLAGCLAGHAEHLNAHCLASLDKFTIMKKCSDDMQTHCAGVQPGYGRVHQCLLQHFSDLSSTCQSYFWGRKDDAKRIIQEEEEREENNRVVVERKPEMIANVYNQNPVHNMSAIHVILLAVGGTMVLGAILVLINCFCTSFTSLVCPARKEKHRYEELDKGGMEMDQMGYRPMLL